MQFTSYFLGAIVGQALLEKRKLSLPAPIITLFHVLTAVIFLGYPFLPYFLLQQDLVFLANPTLVNAIQYPLYLSLWSAANAWFFYYCSANSSNVIARFLSAKIFQPFSRLSFSIYLVHLMTIWYNAHQTRTTISFANMNELVNHSVN